jgi:hypothetical protein
MSSAKQEPNHRVSFPKPTLITPIATTRTQAPTLLTISIAAQRTQWECCKRSLVPNYFPCCLSRCHKRYSLPAFQPAPANPPVNPHHPAAVTGPQITKINRHHKLRNQVINEAIPLVYMQALYNPITGFGNMTTLALMTHLWTNYAKIQPSELNNNEARMTMMWHGNHLCPLKFCSHHLKTVLP